MIKIEKVNIVGWEDAIRGMRNPMNSWYNSDTTYESILKPRTNGDVEIITNPNLGNKDLKLMSSLASSGTDHGKYLRMINVYCDITAPLYWWKEYDTYKVGTVANSCSTMHKIQEKEFELADFSHEHLSKQSTKLLEEYIVKMLNIYRDKFNKTKDKNYWWQIIQLLPSSYNQKRTVMLNYATIRNMYHSRKNHKLDEWSIGFCKWIEQLPYASELIM